MTTMPKLDLELYACEECGSPYCEPCFDRDEDGEYQDSVPSHWLCHEHARLAGYCFVCGQAEPEVKDNPSGLCAECQIDAIREENYDDEY